MTMRNHAIYTFSAGHTGRRFYIQLLFFFLRFLPGIGFAGIRDEYRAGLHFLTQRNQTGCFCMRMLYTGLVLCGVESYTLARNAGKDEWGEIVHENS